MFSWLRRAIGAANRADFRSVHFSVQLDHIHFLVEADGARGLTLGIQGLSIRCALALNRATRRRGKVWSGRFHAHPLRTYPDVARPPMTPRLISLPRTWLLTTGWRRAGGPIDWHEAPAPTRLAGLIRHHLIGGRLPDGRSV